MVPALASPAAAAPEPAGEGPAGTALADHHPLRLLASAVVGRPVAIAYLLQEGAHSYTDGERLYLSARAPVDERRFTLMVQAALLAGRALQPAVLPALVGRAELRQRYLVLEVERCCRLIEDRLPASLMTALAPFATGLNAASAAASLALARGRQPVPAPPPWFGTLQPWKLLRQRLQGDGQKLNDQKLASLEAKLKEIEPDGDTDDDDSSLSKSNFWKFLSSPFGRDNLFSRFMQEVMDMKSSPDKDADNSGMGTSSEMVSGRLSKHVRDLTQAIRSSISVVIPSSLVQAEAGAHSYPEWDCGTRRYRPHWVSVEEVEPHSEEPQFPAGTLSSSGERSLQRALASLCLGTQRHRGQPQGDDLVLDRMIKLAVDLRTGHSGDERIYAANLKTRRDLGVEILLDVSTSTLEKAADGQRVFERQVQAGWQLCRALSQLGDRVAMHGFHSWGRSLVRLQTLKTFDEPLGAVLEQRLQRLAVAGYTRCGAAIRHATAHLQAHSGTPFQLLVLISDGYPYDDQYEGDYAVEDTRKAIEEAGALGVACVCLSVGGDADARRLERVYGAANYLAVDRADQMSTRLRRLMESALAAVAVKR